MWQRMKQEKRIRDDVRWEEISFYGGGGLAPRNFTEPELMAIIEGGYRQLYETWGASIARMLRVNLLGYEYCQDHRHRNRYLEDRAIFHKREAMTLFPLLKPMEIYAPNNTVRKRMKDLRRMYHRVIGEPTAFLAAAEKALVGVAGLARLADHLYPHDNAMVEEPYVRYVYDKPAPPYPECPYQASHPRRAWRHGLDHQVKRRLRNAVAGAQRIGHLIDRARGRPSDEATRRGALMFFV
jgi:hypothetical protein